jgi:hypothetical protein
VEHRADDRGSGLDRRLTQDELDLFEVTENARIAAKILGKKVQTFCPDRPFWRRESRQRVGLIRSRVIDMCGESRRSLGWTLHRKGTRLSPLVPGESTRDTMGVNDNTQAICNGCAFRLN